MEIRTDFRPVPFWSWNDVLVPEELRHQVREMHDKGIGGFFMHARGGLLTKYFSKEWFDAVEEVNVSSKLLSKRWTTELTERDRMFLEKMGVPAF